MSKKALITGITGQDGSYLAELLLSKGYEVHGVIRRMALEDPEHRLSRIKHLLNDLHLHAASLESFPSLYKIVNTIKPDECYHLAAYSFVSYTFEDECSTINTNINGTHYILSALNDFVPDCRFYFSGSSEMFGNPDTSPQNELSRFNPRSAYGISKVAGYHLTRNYREAYGLKAWNGLLYNHESPRRGFEFVTRKISSHAAKIKLGLAKEIRMGNLEAQRDWGHAADYVQAMWKMLQQNTPDDYVIATGIVHRVRDFLDIAFSSLGLNYHDYVVIDPAFVRPADTMVLVGDAGKARRQLGWQPTISFEDLVHEMVEQDLRLMRNRKV